MSLASIIASPGRVPDKTFKLLYLFLISISDSPQQSEMVTQVGKGWLRKFKANSFDKFSANICPMLEVFVCPVSEGWPLCVNERSAEHLFQQRRNGQAPNHSKEMPAQTPGRHHLSERLMQLLAVLRCSQMTLLCCSNPQTVAQYINIKICKKV